MLGGRRERAHRHPRADPEQIALVIVQAHEAHVEVPVRRSVEASEQPHRLFGAGELGEHAAVLVSDEQIAGHRSSRLLGWEGLCRALEDPPADRAPVRGQDAGLAELADPVQVSDGPVELLEGVIRGAAPALELVVGVADRRRLVMCLRNWTTLL
jgi:hypothetical protein